MELHVLDHHLDAEQGVYRLEVGIPIYGEEGELLGHEALPDYVWHADDPRWAGRAPADIAAEQRQIVTNVLNQQIDEYREAEERKAAARRPMPGPADG